MIVPNTRENNRSRNSTRVRRSNDRYPQEDRYENYSPRRNEYDDYDDREQRVRYRSREANYHPKSGGGKQWVIIAIVVCALGAIGLGAYKLLMKPKLAQIISVRPNYNYTKQAYDSCHKVGTTQYVANQKNGTTGAIVGGATGAVAGGIIGNQIKQGGGGTAVGALVGGATGALIGSEVQKSNQPNYIAKHGTTTKCGIAYKTVKVQNGYTVQYLYDNNMASVLTQSAPSVGTQLPLNQLQAMAIPATAGN